VDPRVRERGRADGVGRLMAEGRTGRGQGKLTADEVPRRFSAVVLVLRDRGGGLEWPDPGEYGGVTNLVAGALGGTDHEKVAGYVAVWSPVRPLGVKGEAKVVPRVRGEVVKFMSYLN
jgi:hypothetical protein